MIDPSAVYQWSFGLHEVLEEKTADFFQRNPMFNPEP
jgi:hypothetical protein